MHNDSQNIVNYEGATSSSNDYSSKETSSSPESLPSRLENSVIVEYKEIYFFTDIADVSLHQFNQFNGVREFNGVRVNLL